MRSSDNGSLYNTPPASLSHLGCMPAWASGLSLYHDKRRKRAALREIDRTGFYRGTAQKDSRSLMNVTFRLATEELEKQFIKDGEKAGLDGLKGHRSVGGIRASIYNAFPEAGVDALVNFMQEFERRNG